MARKKLPSANPDISIVDAALQAQECVFDVVRQDLFDQLVRSHVELKFHEPTRILGSAVLFRLLDFYGKIAMSDATKAKIMNAVIAEFPGAELDWRKERCQLVAYNNYLLTIGKMDESQSNTLS